MKVAGIIFGVLTVLIGIYALCVPVQSFLVIGWLVGMVLFADGLTLLIVSLKKEKKAVWKVLLGALAAITGLIILFCDLQRLLTDILMIYMIAGSVVAVGIVQCVVGIKNYQTMKKGLGTFIVGACSVVIGIVAAVHPLLTIVAVGYYIAFSLIMHGLSMIVISMKIGRMKKET
ncbi:MAG: DUF308 domain-containing protein [Eubacteriales bacterium]